MANEANFVLLERTQPPGSSILCFDPRHRITFVSREAGMICLALFGPVAEAKELPPKLRETVVRLSNRKSAAVTGPAELALSLPDGKPVKLRLVRDPELRHHCLIFEREIDLLDPVQIRSLGLSKREAEISLLIYQKKSNLEIARALGISRRTVEKHIENVFCKLEVRNRENLVVKIRQQARPRDVPVTPG